MERLSNEQIFSLVCGRLGLSPDRKGEIYPACPACGKESSRSKVHHSASVRGWKCFVCGGNGGIYDFAVRLGILEKSEHSAPAPVFTPPPVKKVYRWSWMEDQFTYPDYWEVSNRVELWQAYKPIPENLIQFFRLGYGLPPEEITPTGNRLKTSRCEHPRLVLPLIAGDYLLGCRTRSVGCGCEKWLSYAGTPPIFYNAGWMDPQNARANRLGLSRHEFKTGEVILLVENPIDSIMAEIILGIRAVAIMGVTNWSDGWTAALKRARPRSVIVALDHDLAGNGGSNRRDYLRLIEAWKNKFQERNPGRPIPAPPVPNGIKIANRLNQAGVPAELFLWPEDTPDKYDIGEALKEGLKV